MLPYLEYLSTLVCLPLWILLLGSTTNSMHSLPRLFRLRMPPLFATAPSNVKAGEVRRMLDDMRHIKAL